MVLAPFVNYNMDAIFPFCAEAAQIVSAGFIWLKRRFGGKGIFFITSFFILLVGIFLMGWGMDALSSFVAPPTAIPTRTPTSSPTKSLPTLNSTKEVVLIETALAPYDNCLDWSNATKETIGRDICVIGTIYYLERSTHIGIDINFTPFTKTLPYFSVVSPMYPYPDLENGQCILVTGRVLENANGAPYIDLDKSGSNIFPLVDESCKPRPATP
jgi:hypothetical protein